MNKLVAKPESKTEKLDICLHVNFFFVRAELIEIYILNRNFEFNNFRENVSYDIKKIQRF